MCVWKGKRNWDEKFPHWNWPIILSLLIVNNTAYSVMSPSIYQFITTSRTPQGNDKGWPGLGGSELHYAWAIMTYAIGETVIAPVAGFTTERFPYVFSLLATLVFFSIGGIFYANSTQVWMVIVARFIIGLGAGYGAVVVHSYLGEMSTRFDEIRQKKKKKPIKHIFYICFLFLMNGAFVFSFGTTSIVAQFDRVNPYQWPGYFLAALAVLYGFVMIIFFRDIRSLPKLKEIKLNCRCLTGLKLTKQLQSNWKMQFVVYGYLACCGLAGGHLYAINSTIIPPILSDQFGFNVKYTSYYFIGVAIALLASTFILLPAKVFRIDNRKILGVVYVLCFIGAILMGDWQAVNQDDPCLAGSGFDNDTSRQCSESEIFFSGTGESNSELSHHELVKNCTSLSSPSHQCFLNPDSDITGEFCNTCLCACLSKQTTINFYQFTVGILLISFATPLAFVLISAIASDIAPVTSQGTVMSVVVGAPSFSRIVSPLWLVESYKVSENHNYINAGTTALIFLCMIVGMGILYKNLAPTTSTSSSSGPLKRHESTNQVYFEDNKLDDDNVGADGLVWSTEV